MSEGSKRISWLLAPILALSACAPAPPRFGKVDQARVLAADSQPQDWLTSGRDFGKTHYSPLRQINQKTVARLGFAWSFDTGTERVLEATPIVVDNVMYASGPLGRVWALDARNGKQIWGFTPKVDRQIHRKACCDQANRGVALWEGSVYIATLDGALYALDAKTGAVIWRADTVLDHTRGYTITGAPEVAKDVVIIGNAGGEFDVRGYVTAYDLKTGQQKWRFFTVPGAGPPEHPELIMAAKTWGRNARFDLGGGGASWDAIHYDLITDLVFIGTGNGSPYPRHVRDPNGGDNLFLCSILAINPDTGRLVWHHQQTPAEQWDFTATQPMILADLEINGALRHVLMQAPKNGFFYVYDRHTGEVLSADKYARANWASHVDLKSGRAIELSMIADYAREPKLISPAVYGAHGWAPMAFSAKTKLVYIPAADGGNILWSPAGSHQRRPGLFNPGAVPFFPDQIRHAPDSLPPPVRAVLPKLIRDKNMLDEKAYLRAWDPVRRKVVWQTETSGPQDRGGVLATAGGLVFQGSTNGRLRIFDHQTGALLKQIDTGSSIMAAPMTYKIGGVQYVSVMAAWGGGGWVYPHRGDAYLKYGNSGRILTFKLGGGATPKPPEIAPPGPIPAPPSYKSLGLNGSPRIIAKGEALFTQNCSLCHSNMTGSMAPDLRRMNADTHAAFLDIVLDGALKDGGMPGWKDVLNARDAHAIHTYLIALAVDQTAKK